MRFTALIKKIKFDRYGLVCTIIQNEKNGQVLMQAYMNRQALRKTLQTGTAHFWSRSRKKLWRKGEVSGHIQKVRSIFLDCDGDALLIKVAQVGASCHTGYKCCFYRKIGRKTGKLKVIGKKVFDPKKVYRK